MENMEQGFAELAGVTPEVQNMEQPMVEEPAVPAPSDVTPASEGVAQPEVQEQQLQQPPQFDPSQLTQVMTSQSEQIAQIAQQMSQMNSRIPEQQQAPQTEEEMLQAKIREDLGINKIEEQYKQQTEMLEQQKQMMAQMQAQEQARQRDMQFKSLEQEFGNIDKEAIQNRLVEIGKTNPQMAEALNSPEGIRMLLQQGVGTVVATPDPITPSANSNNVGIDDSASRVLEGKGTDDDFGALLESYV